MKQKKKKKKRKKITAKLILKWFFIFLGCAILIFGCIFRVLHYYSEHAK